MDLNKVMLIGRLTRDPESRTTPQGATVTNFGLATSRVWKDQQGNQQDRTEFHNVVAWRRLGEICAQYLQKGRQVYIEGHLQTRNWEDNNGVKQYRTEVVADNMIMLGSKNESGQSNTAPGQQANQQAEQTVASTQGNKPQNESAPAPNNEEEIRIEDIPF